MTNVSAVEKKAELMQQMEENSPRVAALQYCLTQVAEKVEEAEKRNAELEARCAALSAENSGLKELIEQHANSVAVCPNCSHEEPSETDDIVALYRSMETPATDAFLAEVRAQGVEMLASLAGNECQRYKSVNDRSGARKWKSIVILCTDFAAQLRKGVQS
ncbi:hypothetical protein N8Q21_20480 [Enterobacter hormaechei subsp. xiangfangensis]|uniref:hypothetical protein n=1 Tax=Enterobacter cloacae complex sp. 392K2 TaxID=3395834 RepID=UPI002074E695|nr:hypothetical protein [Enterobacter hormaechei]ELT0445583.1 hypothetical protein [Enterobacter hormaechei subsp. xiangfangensis]ELX8365398.1 hypothetical protein [Enterobacter hormaechei]MCM7443686.1 hypothetical protein [Enterobacter hormaechei]MCU2363573.1 hypothetical protein [Enterobacter hormaechei subsp. xiangfangensis]